MCIYNVYIYIYTYIHTCIHLADKVLETVGDRFQNLLVV